MTPSERWTNRGAHKSVLHENHRGDQPIPVVFSLCVYESNDTVCVQ